MPSFAPIMSDIVTAAVIVAILWRRVARVEAKTNTIANLMAENVDGVEASDVHPMDD